MSDLLDEQGRLQREADHVVELLQLESRLARIGKPIRVGSSALGLMVRRDIDITVVCEELSSALCKTFAQLCAELMAMDRYVASVRFRNDTGAWNADPAAYPDGLYLGMSVRTDQGADWTVDIWAVDEPDRQPDLEHLRTLPPRLSDDHRQAILTIKRALAAASSASPATEIPSAYVYEAVVEGAVRNAEQFSEWLAGKSSARIVRF